MDQQNPLTDPTSLIAYRLANDDSSLRNKPAHLAAGKAQAGSPAVVAFGLAIAALFAIAVLIAIAVLVL